MAVKRQVSKKKLLAWLEENKNEIQQPYGNYYTVNPEKLIEVIHNGELDMTKDWRLNKDEV